MIPREVNIRELYRRIINIEAVNVQQDAVIAGLGGGGSIDETTYLYMKNGGLLAGDGADGNYGLDTSTGDLFGPKAAGAWPGVAIDNLFNANVPAPSIPAANYAHIQDKIFNLGNVMQVISSLGGNDWDAALADTQRININASPTSSASLNFTFNANDVECDDDGRYVVNVSATLSPRNAGTSWMQLVKNGTDVLDVVGFNSSGGGFYLPFNVSWIGDLVATDTLDLRLSATSGDVWVFGWSINVHQIAS